jgi:hypothetical protein
MSGFVYSETEPQVRLPDSKLVAWLDVGVILCGLHRMQGYLAP